jgi:hypothetical protein
MQGKFPHSHKPRPPEGFLHKSSFLAVSNKGRPSFQLKRSFQGRALAIQAGFFAPEGFLRRSSFLAVSNQGRPSFLPTEVQHRTEIQCSPHNQALGPEGLWLEIVRRLPWALAGQLSWSVQLVHLGWWALAGGF